MGKSTNEESGVYSIRQIRALLLGDVENTRWAPYLVVKNRPRTVWCVISQEGKKYWFRWRPRLGRFDAVTERHSAVKQAQAADQIAGTLWESSTWAAVAVPPDGLYAALLESLHTGQIES